MPKLRTLRHKLRPSSAIKLRPPPKRADPFYLSPEWRDLIEEIKAERWPRLKRLQGHYCEDPDCKAQHTPETRIFFDHVKERRDYPQLALIKSNIMGRCGSSHTRKTMQVRRERHQGEGGSNL